ncbi:MAG: chemotaxis protein CheW [Anaerolineae bacterium]|nr:chemotaxis protein CheW [Anaerolineae bacterium]
MSEAEAKLESAQEYISGVPEDPSGGKDEILELAASRRREKQVVDVELTRMLVVVMCFDGVSVYYGLPASAVESIVPAVNITFVPGAPPWIPGVVNVRGEIESVLDLRAVLGHGQAMIHATSGAGPGTRAGSRSIGGVEFGRDVATAPRLLIAHDGDLRSGLLVDRVVDILEIASPLPPPMAREGSKGVYVAGEAEYDGQELVLLDLGEVFRRALEGEATV